MNGESLWMDLKEDEKEKWMKMVRRAKEGSPTMNGWRWRESSWREKDDQEKRG